MKAKIKVKQKVSPPKQGSNEWKYAKVKPPTVGGQRDAEWGAKTRTKQRSKSKAAIVLKKSSRESLAANRSKALAKATAGG